MHSKLILALTLSATLATPLALGGGALAASPMAVLPARDLGMAIMSANVDGDGNLYAGAGAIGAIKRTNGQYFVAFNRSVQGCTHVGAASGALAFFGDGFVSTEAHSDTLNGATYFGLSVATAGPNGLAKDQSFHLIVFCSK